MDRYSVNSAIRKWLRIEKSDWIALGICVLTFAGWMVALTYKYLHFGYYDWDLALFSQTMWSLVHGSARPSLFGMNFLANHANYIAFFLVPIYAIFQSPLTLIALKVISYTAGAYILYLIAKKSLGYVFALIIMLLYLAYPANIFAMFHEFQFENLAVIFLFLMYYFFQEKRFVAFCVAMFFACMVKENIPLIAIAFGIYVVFSKRKNKIAWGIVPIVFGALVFCGTLALVVPALRRGIGSPNAYLSYLYGHLGDKSDSLLQTILSYPVSILRAIATPRNFVFINELFGPLLLLNLLSPHVVFLVSPILLQHLLSSAHTQHTIYYHYGATIAPFIFLASVNSLRWIRDKMRPLVYRTIFILSVLLCAFNTLSYGHILSLRIGPFKDRLDPIRTRIIEQIPTDASVIATFDFLDRLSQRKDLYAFYSVYRGRNIFTPQSPYPDPKQVDYALIDFSDQWRASVYDPTGEIVDERIKEFFASEKWYVMYAVESIFLFGKDLSTVNQER